MLKKNFDDPSFELFKTSQIIRLIDTVIYSIIDGKIFKFKVSDINISMLNNDVYVSLNCSPLEEQYMHLFYTDIELNYKDFGSIWFYSLDAARNYKINQYKKGQLSLF